MEMMANRPSSHGGTCPVMGVRKSPSETNPRAENFDPLNCVMKHGWNCSFRSRWSFIFANKGSLSLRKFHAATKKVRSLPLPLLHTLFASDEVKALRYKPFSGLFQHFEKIKEKANKAYNEKKYMDAIEIYEQILAVFKWVEFKDTAKNEEFFKKLNFEPILDETIQVTQADLKGDECEETLRQNLVLMLIMNVGQCFHQMHFREEAMKCFKYVIEHEPKAIDARVRIS